MNVDMRLRHAWRISWCLPPGESEVQVAATPIVRISHVLCH